VILNAVPAFLAAWHWVPHCQSIGTGAPDADKASARRRRFRAHVRRAAGYVMPMRRPFQQVNVFSPTRYGGNPVAVVLNADGLSTTEMERLGRWTNLSETTFLLAPTRPDADYRVRIFNLARELPFAGHPTLGSCHAWLNAGHEPKQDGLIIQECAAGLISVRRRDDTVAFAAPPLVRTGPVEESYVEHIAALLQIERSDVVDAHWVDNGPGWVAVLLDGADAVLNVKPVSAAEGTWDIGVVGAYPPGSECAFEVRAFFTDERGGLVEDPVTGSLNASLAQWLLSTRRATAPYVAGQGTQLGRTGRVHIEQDTDGTIWVGGTTTTCIDGHIDI
jgi:PhzF family phenazine biosynthesis protein